MSSKPAAARDCAGSRSIRSQAIQIFDCLNVVQSNANVYVESSGIPETGTESLIERAVLETSAERVVFGTNMPINHPQMELERIRVAAIPETARQQILGSNMAKILALR